jgi:hypothetical protein
MSFLRSSIRFLMVIKGVEIETFAISSKDEIPDSKRYSLHSIEKEMKKLQHDQLGHNFTH